MKTHQSRDLILIFNECFQSTENTILIGDAEEPVYLPKDDSSPFHRIVFTRDYFASALHEIAHWCIASAERRAQVDYGYWYYPEGRTPEQQILFEHAEVKPQALECLFSQAAGYKFRVSRDNFSDGASYSPSSFELKIADQVQRYLQNGLPVRAKLFYERLLRLYQARSAPSPTIGT